MHSTRLVRLLLFWSKSRQIFFLILLIAIIQHALQKDGLIGEAVQQAGFCQPHGLGDGQRAGTCQAHLMNDQIGAAYRLQPLAKTCAGFCFSGTAVKLGCQMSFTAVLF